MDSHIKRNYRKKLCTRGFIHFNGIKAPIILRNISLTGALVDINTYDAAYAEMLLQNLNAHCEVAIKLPEIKLSAEAELIRMENHSSHLLLGLKFISEDEHANPSSYKRRTLRKKLSVPGEFIYPDHRQTFETVNISTGGMMLVIENDIDFDVNVTKQFAVNSLGLAGDVKIVWINPKPPVGIAMGVEFIELKSKPVKPSSLVTLQ